MPKIWEIHKEFSVAMKPSDRAEIVGMLEGAGCRVKSEDSPAGAECLVLSFEGPQSAEDKAVKRLLAGASDEVESE